MCSSDLNGAGIPRWCWWPEAESEDVAVLKGRAVFLVPNSDAAAASFRFVPTITVIVHAVVVAGRGIVPAVPPARRADNGRPSCNQFVG